MAWSVAIAAVEVEPAEASDMTPRKCDQYVTPSCSDLASDQMICRQPVEESKRNRPRSSSINCPVPPPPPT